ncbi:MAG TPA: hypothetical protein V6C88_00805 [Chroococcidiopsis sp.]
MKFIHIKSLSVALSLVAALSLTACGGGGTTEQASTAPAPSTAEVEESPAVAEPAVAETEAAETVASPAAEDIVAEYVFTNTGSVEICELYLSPVEEESWGPDQLEDQTIPAGEKFTLQNIPAGSYDAKAVGCDGAGEATLKLDITN